MEEFSMVVVWLAFFASIFFGWYFYLQARNRERMALIEKNAEVAEIFKRREFKFKFPWLKLGMIVLGMGIGILISSGLIALNFLPGIPEEIVVSGGLMVFRGLGLVIAYFIER